MQHIATDIPSQHYCTLHLNIRRLPSKIDDLKDLISSLKEYSVIVNFILLGETFLNDRNIGFCSIPGYNLIPTRNRKTDKVANEPYIEPRWCSGKPSRLPRRPPRCERHGYKVLKLGSLLVARMIT